MKIEVAYALYDQQFLYQMDVEEGITVEKALRESPLLKKFPDLNIEKVGIFSALVKPEHVLRDGDRIEVYRPLKIDPRERRRKKVEEEKQ